MREKALLIEKVSAERIRDELSKILVAEDPSPAFQLLMDTGILSLILPEVARLRGVEQNCYHKDDVFVHTMEVIKRSQAELSLRLAALLHDISKPETLSIDSPEVIKTKSKSTIRHFYCHESVGAKKAKEILKRLKFDKDTVSSVSSIVRHHMRPIECGQAGLRRILRDLNGDYEIWRKLKEADASSCATDPEIVAAQLTEFDQRVEELLAEPEVHKFSNLAVNGKDLMSLGFEAGRDLGDTLSKLHEVVIENPVLNNKNALLAKAKDILNSLANKNR
jgi:tRNA nucleotidyltransferase (CCA-adding enzyme)